MQILLLSSLLLFVRELNIPLAASRIQAVGLVPKFVESNDPDAFGFRQSPRSGRLVSYNSTVTLQMRSGSVP